MQTLISMLLVAYSGVYEQMLMILNSCKNVYYTSRSENLLFVTKKMLCMPRHSREELQLFISVFLILVGMWPGTLTQNFSKSAWEKGYPFINVFTLVTYAVALVKVCFYLILKILLLIEKLSHKLGKCSIIGTTEIDLGRTIGHTTGKWGSARLSQLLQVARAA